MFEVKYEITEGKRTITRTVLVAASTALQAKDVVEHSEQHSLSYLHHVSCRRVDGGVYQVSESTVCTG